MYLLLQLFHLNNTPLLRVILVMEEQCCNQTIAFLLPCGNDELQQAHHCL